VSLEIVPFMPEHQATWDQWCADSANGTFLHARKFLGYHGARFEDASALLYSDGRLVGVLPAARALQDPSLVVSHPGATYGGLVHQGWLAGLRMIEALEHLQGYFCRRGFARLLYKPLPYTYARVPSQDDLYALFRVGARRVRCDLSSAIDLSSRRLPSERRRRGLRKAMRFVSLTGDAAYLANLWSVLADNLARKHEAAPVHSLAELAQLQQLFPQNILLRCALVDGRVEAGVVLFNSANVWHAQYIASSERGYELSALDAVFEAVIKEASQAGARYFDFGTSNEDGGRTLNDGLYRFKSEFGGGGVAHEFYELTW